METTALLNFILGLLGSEDAAASFVNDPEGALAAAGLGDISCADIDAVMPVVADYLPVVAGGGASAVAGVAGASTVVGQLHVLLAAYPAGTVTTTTTINSTDIAQNIWADDVNQAFGFGDGVTVAGEDNEVVGGDVITADDGGIIAGGDVANDGSQIGDDIDDSYNQDNDDIAIDSNNQDNDVVTIDSNNQDNDDIAIDSNNTDNSVEDSNNTTEVEIDDDSVNVEDDLTVIDSGNDVGGDYASDGGTVGDEVVEPVPVF